MAGQFSEGYRFGFNGKEKDDEVKGSANSLDFGARIHDPRIGRFLSLDPSMDEFPFMSPYCFAGNNPIAYIDVNGEAPGRKKPKTRGVLTNFNATQVAASAHSQLKSKGLLPSANAIAMTISFESLSLSMYDIDGNPKGNTTIGFGHKIHSGPIEGGSSETEFKDGITIEKATELLISDINDLINPSLLNRVKNRGLTDNITQNEYDVAFDLEFNTGNSGKYLNKLNKVKKLETRGKTDKADKARGKLTNWLSKQYPGIDEKRGTARAVLNEGVYNQKGNIIKEVEVKGKKKGG